jgi:hypothetical protein
MRNLKVVLWRWSWLVTLPVTILFCYWSWVTAERFHDFGVRFNAMGFGDMVSLQAIGDKEFHHIWHSFSLELKSTFIEPATAPEIRQIPLFIQESALAKLNSHLPASGFEYVEGHLLDDGELLKVKIRYRGDFLSHWAGFKKSLRIKTRKKRLFDGMRKFNLVAPKATGQLHNYLGYRLAEAMGVIAPKSELVEVILNGKLYGMLVMVEQLEELTIRRHGLMPGDIYAGEFLAKDAYAGISDMVVEHPGLWKKVSVNNHFAKDSIEPLKRLMSLVTAKQTQKVRQQLASLLDIEEWGRFLAYTTLSQTYHYDETHNWRLYFDPARSKFIPVAWDPYAWRLLNDKKKPVVTGIITSRLHERLYQNSDILLAKQRIIADFFNSGHAEQFLTHAQSSVKKVESVVRHDPNLFNSNPDEVVEAMYKLTTDIGDLFAQLEQNLLREQPPLYYAQSSEDGRVIALQIDGREPVESVELEYSERLGESLRVKVQFELDGELQVVDVTGSTAVSGRKVIITIPLLSRQEM